MMYIRVWLMVIYREGQEFMRNCAGRVTGFVAPIVGTICHASRAQWFREPLE